jgi:hypothetical protein
MEDGLLWETPLQMVVWDRRVLLQRTGQEPPEQIGVVQQRLKVIVVVVQHYWISRVQTSANTSKYKPGNPAISDRCSSIKTLNWELTHEQTS